tara:strand:- start:393 stop:1853 length:1461 start_codon:yes stop_codon:yes gene_type:complete
MSFLSKKYDNLIKYIIILFPLFLITGPFLPDFFCIFVGLSYLFFYSKNDKINKSEFHILIFFVLLYIYLNINSLISFNSIISFKSSVPFLRIIIFIFALSYFFKTQKDIGSKLYFFFIVCIVILLIDSLYQFINNQNIFGTKPASVDRITSFFDDEQIMGSFISRLLPCIIALSYLIKIKKKDIFNYFILSVAFILIFLSGERLALAYFFIFLTLYFVIDFNKTRTIYFLSFIIICATSLSLINSNQFKKFFVHTYNQLTINKTYFTSYRHLLHYRTSYSMYKDKPLFGHGLKSFRHLCSDPKYFNEQEVLDDNNFYSPVDGIVKVRQEDDIKEAYVISVIEENGVIHNIGVYNIKNNLYFSKFKNGDPIKKGDTVFQKYEFKNGCNTHSHNIYFQFLSELGLIGTAFLLTIFIYVLYNLFILLKMRINRKIDNIDKAKFLILSGIFISLIPIFPSGNYFNNWLLIITYFPIGIYLSLLKSRLNNE